MSKVEKGQTEPVTIDIDDLTELVGGVLSIASLNETVLVAPARGSVAYNPDTCPTSPGGPVSTCMCPSNRSLLPGGPVIQPAISF
jgi:hypothetical protein